MIRKIFMAGMLLLAFALSGCITREGKDSFVRVENGQFIRNGNPTVS